MTDSPGQPVGGVVITIGQIYAELREMHNSLNDLHSKFEGVPTQVSDHESRLRIVEGYGLSDHDARITSLEQRKVVAPAAFAWSLGTAIAALAVLVTFLGIILGGHS